MMLKIAKYPDIILRKKAKAVSGFDGELIKLVSDMADAMYGDDGIGLAAPQISVGKRVFILGENDGHSFKVYVNPEITWSSPEKKTNEEGCLSVPNVFGLVERSKKIHMKYQDVEGKMHKEKIKGFPAIVMQHEMDHINGILFIDRATQITTGQEILDSLKNE